MSATPFYFSDALLRYGRRWFCSRASYRFTAEAEGRADALSRMPREYRAVIDLLDGPWAATTQ